MVALRKESVDRNFDAMKIVIVEMQSLSARRAWIEICCACCSVRLLAVALRKESVDRNPPVDTSSVSKSVALRKESVDRNNIRITAIDCIIGRSPQGERG